MNTKKIISILIAVGIFIVISLAAYYPTIYGIPVFSQSTSLIEGSGILSANIFSSGVFSVGIFSVGIFSAGIFSFGVFSIGIFNLALYAGVGIFVKSYYKGKGFFVDAPIKKTLKDLLKD